MIHRAPVSWGGKKNERGERGNLDLQRFLRFGGTHPAFQNQCPEGGVVEIVDVAYFLLSAFISRIGNARWLTVDLPPTHVISQVLYTRILHSSTIETR